MAARVLLMAALCVGLSCGGASSSTSLNTTTTVQAPLRAPVVIVTIDGVRWQEIFHGTDPEYAEPPRVDPPQSIVPNLYRLGTERGAFIGASGHGLIEASGPEYISLPGYSEIFSGRSNHGCASNE